MRRRRYYRSRNKGFYAKYKHTIHAVVICMGVSYYMPKDWFSWNVFGMLKGGK